jgi:WD40 repeat protein
MEVPHGGEIILWNFVSRNGRIILKQDSPVRSVAFSRDRNRMVVGDFSGSFRLLDGSTGACIDEVLKPESPINAVAISAQGDFMISGALDGTFFAWRFVPKQVDFFNLPDEKIINVALSSDNRLAAVTGQKGKAYVFNLFPLKQLHTVFAFQEQGLEGASVEAIAFAPNSHDFATGCRNQLRIWEGTSGKMSYDVPGLPVRINSIAYSPDGKLFAAVDDNGTLSVWEADSKHLIKSFRAHNGISFCVAFSFDGKYVATAGRNDFKTKIWDTRTLTLAATLERRFGHGTNSLNIVTSH